ncbi:MAG: ABC transporter substrate-binding protein [Candidatus Jettenia sp. CY-1]|nr:MAG: ABC transporter substrate-binding protein [Candidatus Jettenia sp. CY-1]
MKRLFFLLLVTVLSYSLSAFAQTVEVVDFRGKTVRLKEPPERIVCLIESALSGIYMLNEGHRIVGVSKNVYHGNVYQYYAVIDKRIKDKALPAPGNWDFVSLEGILALRPDLVIMWAQQTEAIEAVENAGVPVFGVFVDSIEDVFNEINIFGVLTKSEKRASEIIAYTQREINSIVERMKSIDKDKHPSVYYLWAQSLLNTSCKGSVVDDLIAMAGGENICTETKEHAVITMERLISADPDVIIMWHNERLDPKDLMLNKQLRNITAIRDKRVYELPEVFHCDLWTLKFHYALKLIAKWLHPELLHELDMKYELDKMSQMLYGKTF